MSKHQPGVYSLRGGLFERLARQTDEGSYMPLHQNEVDSILASIKRNLNNILNTRGGGALSTPKLGVGDFNDAEANSVNILKSISQDIRSIIEKFEPRIKDLDIHALNDAADPLRLQFTISGVVSFENKSHTLEFNLLIDKGNKCKIY